MKNFLSVDDVSDVPMLLTTALDYKANPLKDKQLGQGKRIGLLFFNPSLRTRLSTQIAAQNLGMEAIVFNAGNDGWALEFADGAIMDGNTVEHVKDAAAVMGSYFDILCVRAFPSLVNRDTDYSELVMQQLVRYAGIPVMSLESSTLHPLQSLADVITIKEQMLQQQFKQKPKVVLSWAPHIKPVPQCVANSFAQWMSAWDEVELTIVQPQGYELCANFTREATISYSQDEALRDADFIYVKSWSSYENYGKLDNNLSSWMLTEDRLSMAPSTKIMHCLPVRRNVELADDLLDGNRSLVNKQAENRVWSAQAVLSTLIQQK